MSDKQKTRYSVVPGRAAYDARLAPSDIRVLIALGTYTDDHGWCYPQQSTIAADLGMRRPTVSTAIARLAEWGYVQSERRVAKGRGMRGLWYRVLLDTKTQPQDIAPVSVNADTGSDREQNGEMQPVSANADTGAGVSKRRTPVSANADTGYIAEGSQEKDIPHSPRERGQRTKTNPKGKRVPQRTAREPAEFAAAWALWPKPGSSKARALKAWRESRATGAQKLAAVKAYLATQTARAENYRFVPYFQRWLTNSLGSFVEVAARNAEAVRRQANAPRRKAGVYCRDCRTTFDDGVKRCACPAPANCL